MLVTGLVQQPVLADRLVSVPRRRLAEHLPDLRRSDGPAVSPAADLRPATPQHHRLTLTSAALETPAAAITAGSTFWLVVAAIALNAFVTFGFSAILIELLKAEGLPPAEAVAFGSALGVIQVSARGIDFLGGGRWDGIATGLFAGVALPVAMAVLIVGGGAYWSVAAFILLYGLGSGALAVARATIPLVFYDKAAVCQDDLAYRAAAQRDLCLGPARTCSTSHAVRQQRRPGSRDPLFVQCARDPVHSLPAPPNPSACVDATLIARRSVKQAVAGLRRRRSAPPLRAD